MTPATELPLSETHGLGTLDVQGNCFANLPPLPTAYVSRPGLEKELFTKLLDDRHPVITVRGSGGIGKTSLAITVFHALAREERFGAIIWFSARDIDLLAQGPKDVKPQVLTESDIAKEFAQFLPPSRPFDHDYKPNKYLADSLTASPISDPILFVFDNFETVRSPTSLYSWIDAYIRNPNKVFITTRFSDFKGDYPVEVLGMTEPEAEELITETAHSLGIRKLLTPDYRREVFRESDGHPYVIKILLGEVSRAGRAQQVQRIISLRGDILDALFERTYSGLSPATRIVFMTLCNWRSTVPQLAVEAVMLRPQKEKVDVDAAIDELKRSSLIETRESGDGNSFLTVPLVAAIFGKRKLAVSAEKTIVESNSEILRFLGASQKSDIQRGLGPRLNAMFAQMALRISKDGNKLHEYLPIMEFVANRYPSAWLLLARLYEESSVEGPLERAKEATRKFLELTSSAEEQLPAWKKLAEYCRRTNDWNGEIHALVAMVEVPKTTLEDMSNVTNRLNSIFGTHQFLLVDERNLLVERLAKVMEQYVPSFNATDCSRLAWMYLRLKQDDKARVLVETGLALEPINEYCLKLQDKFNSGQKPEIKRLG